MVLNEVPGTASHKVCLRRGRKPGLGNVTRWTSFSAEAGAGESSQGKQVFVEKAKSKLNLDYTSGITGAVCSEYFGRERRLCILFGSLSMSQISHIISTTYRGFVNIEGRKEYKRSQR